MFDPNKHKPGAGAEFVTSAGTYICVFKRLKERGTSRNDNPYLNLVVEVIGGSPAEQVGRKFSERIFINEKSWNRLGAMFAAMQHQEAVNLASNAECARAMLFKPFKCKVKMEEYEGNSYARIAFFDHQPDDFDGAIMNNWVNENGDFIQRKLEELNAPVPDDDEGGWSAGGF